MSKRLSKVYLLIGKKGTGKTFFTKQLMKKYPQKVLVFDTFDHPDYRGIVKDMPIEKLPQWKSGIYRILSTDPERDLPIVFDNIYNCLLVLEDAKRYISDNPPKYIKQLFIENKNRSVDVIIQYHFLRDASLYAVGQSQHLVMFQVKDNMEGRPPDKWATWWDEITVKQNKIRELNAKNPDKPWNKVEIELE